MSINATAGDMEGEINLIWEPVTGANSYLIQKSMNLLRPVRWHNEDIVSKPMHTVSKLRSRHKYWFRVAAVGPKGQGRWSKPVCKIAP